MEDPLSATPEPKTGLHANDREPSTIARVDQGLSLTITRMFRLCWVKRRLFGSILAIGILSSILYAFRLPVLYTATTTLMPPDFSSSNSSLVSVLSSTGMAAGVAGEALGLETSGAVFTGIMESRNVQEGLVKRFDLFHHYKTANVGDACQRLAAATRIRENPKNGIISIDVTDNNPVLATNLAQGYVAELDRVVSNDSTSAARRERVFLEERLTEIKKDLDDSAKALSQFSARSKTIDIASQGRAMVESGLKLQDQMAAARAELAALQQSYSEDNVKVRAARARIAELQREIDRMMGSTGQPSPDRSNSAYPSVSELPALGLTYSDLERRVHVEEELWDTLTKEYEAAKVQEAKEIPTVHVLDVANVPQHRSAPNRRRVVVVGAALSFFVACLIVLISSRWDEMDPRDERKKFVAEIIDSMLRSLRWMRHIPGVNWIYARLNGSRRRDVTP